MNLPEQPTPSTFRPSSEQPWHWRLEDSSGAEVEVTGELAGQTFPSQGDAESWVGEIWQELADAGVAQVTLFEADREVYGPMSLSA